MQPCTCRLLLIVSNVFVLYLKLTFLVAGQFKYTLCKRLAKAIAFVNMYKLSVLCTLYALCKPWEGWMSSFLSGEGRKEGPARTCKCWEILRLLPGKSKSTLYLYRSIRYCRSDMHPCPSLHFFFFLIYTQRCCVTLVLFGIRRFFIATILHTDACPECQSVCLRVGE